MPCYQGAPGSSNWTLCLAGDSGQVGESDIVADGQVGQYLAIDHYTRLDQATDHLVVGRAAQPCGRIDADNPQAPELTLAIAAVAIGVPHRVHSRFVGSPIEQMLAALLTLGKLEYCLVPLMGRHAPFHSRQLNDSLRIAWSAVLFEIRQEALDVHLLAASRNFDLAPIQALGALRPPASQVALMALWPHELAGSGPAESLRCRLSSLDLWHGKATSLDCEGSSY